jgi:hypothetical protein
VHGTAEGGKFRAYPRDAFRSPCADGERRTGLGKGERDRAARLPPATTIRRPLKSNAMTNPTRATKR